MTKEWMAHEDIIRDFTEVPGLGFVSVSNDETGKFWTLEGDLLYELRGHNGFVFAVHVLPSGEIITGSDDKSIKVWNSGSCIQTINHPQTVWSITSNTLGDLITACEDYSIRTFTRDPERKANEEELKEWENEVKASNEGD
jgi:phospholipase A-2-activating protein